MTKTTSIRFLYDDNYRHLNPAIQIMADYLWRIRPLNDCNRATSMPESLP
jgi:hypothetical protein